MGSKGLGFSLGAWFGFKIGEFTTMVRASILAAASRAYFSHAAAHFVPGPGLGWGCGIEVSGFGVFCFGVGFRVWGLEFGVWGLWFKVLGLRFGLRIEGAGFKI